MIKNILILLSLIFTTKLVEDNIPNLHYKKLFAGFVKHVLPFLLSAYLGFLYSLAKLTRNQQAQKNYTMLLLLMVLTVALSKLIEDKKQAAL